MISLTSPVKTRAHTWPAGVKLGALCLATLILFIVQNLWAQLAIFCGVLIVLMLPGRSFLIAALKPLRLLWPFLVIVSLWHLWTGEIIAGAVILLRLVSAVLLANLVTMTTRLSDMIDVVHYLTHPLRRIGLQPRVLELSIALVIRLTPVLVLKGETLADAWRARSRRRPGWRIVLPFTLLALDDAEQVAEALQARGGFTSIKD
ncbi:energy-coupling factor transporter transmembrane component T family protein [Lutimaribacter marinistellae]|uniref:Energy-coupling factor transporter transmembrane component T family protein n=1 Tax=Lutimaribacter marinistellae TaxID=1820329 RepID=A0ABV7TFZ1_9RHOB